MLLLNPESYNKLKDEITNGQELSFLDKKMSKILKNRKINDVKKWYLYRQQLIKYALLKRNSILNNLQDNSFKFNKSNIQRATQTTSTNKPKIQRATQTTPTIEYADYNEDDYLKSYHSEDEDESNDIPPYNSSIKALTSSNPEFYRLSFDDEDDDDEMDIDDQFFTPKLNSSRKNDDDKVWSDMVKERELVTQKQFEIKEQSPKKKETILRKQSAKRKIWDTPLPANAKRRPKNTSKKFKESTPSTSGVLIKKQPSNPKAEAPTSIRDRILTRAYKESQQKGGSKLCWERL